MGRFEFFNRDISWLSFNLRVLEEAEALDLPLYERVKYLAIYSSNLDEFYRVRVASYRSLLDLPAESRAKLNYVPEEILAKINDEVKKQHKKFINLFYNSFLIELKKKKIILHMLGDKINSQHHDFIESYFFQEVLPHIQPTLLFKGDIVSFLEDNLIYLAIRLFKKRYSNHKKKKTKHAVLKIPTHHLPRFIELPKIDDTHHYIIFLDDIIRYNLHKIFPGYHVDAAFSMKVSRDAELNIEDEFKGNLLEKIRRSLSKRKTGNPARFLYDQTIPKESLKFVRQAFNLSKEDLVPGGRYHNLHDLHSLPNPLSPQLEVSPWPPLPHPNLMLYESIFEAIKLKDYMLHFPYQSFDYVLRFLNEAAVDSKVEEIKVTQYRVASNSAVVNALISAARNGKKVTVFVEAKARFDEELNLYFADLMSKAGVKIIPSIPNIKVHSKIALVLRRSSGKNSRKGFAFLSTGNLNEKTAKLYADDGLFTTSQEIIDELKELFIYLETLNKEIHFNHILVPNFNMRSSFKNQIENEILHANEGKKAYILLKMNSLEEPKMIEKLYEASLAGVEIDLIIRGICRIIPNQEYSKNIKIKRIVDRYLEHSRVFIFYNLGEYNTYISSADWMKRNLYRRIEAAIPIYDKDIKQELLDMLNIQLKDNIKARIINENLENIIIKREPGQRKIRSQEKTYEYFKRKYEKALDTKNETESNIPNFIKKE